MTTGPALILDRDHSGEVSPLDIGGALMLSHVEDTSIGVSDTHTINLVGRMAVAGGSHTRIWIPTEKEPTWRAVQVGGSDPLWIRPRDGPSTKQNRARSLQDGDVIDLGSIELRFSAETSDDPLARTVCLGPALCLSCDNAVEAGRRDAIMAIDGVVRRVTLLARPIADAWPPLVAHNQPAPIAKFQTETLIVDVLPSMAGALLKELGHEQWGFLEKHPWDEEVLITWDGAFHYRPHFIQRHRTANQQPLQLRPHDVAAKDVVRGVLPERWRRERELREQVALLDVAGLDWLKASAMNALGPVAR